MLIIPCTTYLVKIWERVGGCILEGYLIWLLYSEQEPLTLLSLSHVVPATVPVNEPKWSTLLINYSKAEMAIMAMSTTNINILWGLTHTSKWIRKKESQRERGRLSQREIKRELYCRVKARERESVSILSFYVGFWIGLCILFLCFYSAFLNNLILFLLSWVVYSRLEIQERTKALNTGTWKMCTSSKQTNTQTK